MRKWVLTVDKLEPVPPSVSRENVARKHNDCYARTRAKSRWRRWREMCVAIQSCTTLQGDEVGTPFLSNTLQTMRKSRDYSFCYRLSRRFLKGVVPFKKILESVYHVPPIAQGQGKPFLVFLFPFSLPTFSITIFLTVPASPDFCSTPRSSRISQRCKLLSKWNGIDDPTGINFARSEWNFSFHNSGRDVAACILECVSLFSFLQTSPSSVTKSVA